MEKLKHSFFEVVSAVLPMTVIIMLLSLFIAPFTAELWVCFFVGTCFMIIGMTLFLFGSEFSMMEVGHLAGTYLISQGKIVGVMVFGFLIGVVITIAEPDVQVLATQVFNVSEGRVQKLLLLLFVGIGVGIFVVIGLLRIIFQKSLRLILFVGYIVVFAVAFFFSSSEFFPIALDAGGVTTGPLTVPFILALGSGATSVIRSNKEGDDSFGMVGLASLGPILAVLVLGVIFR